MDDQWGRPVPPQGQGQVGPYPGTGPVGPAPVAPGWGPPLVPPQQSDPAVLVLRILATVFSVLGVAVGGMMSLMLLGLSAMCTDDGDSSDCAGWVATAFIPVGVAFVSLVCAVIAWIVKKRALSIGFSVASLVGGLAVVGVLGLIFL